MFFKFTVLNIQRPFLFHWLPVKRMDSSTLTLDLFLENLWKSNADGKGLLIVIRVLILLHYFLFIFCTLFIPFLQFIIFDCLFSPFFKASLSLKTVDLDLLGPFLCDLQVLLLRKTKTLSFYFHQNKLCFTSSFEYRFWLCVNNLLINWLVYNLFVHSHELK